MTLPHILDLTMSQLASRLEEELSVRPFVARQVRGWAVTKGILHPELFSDLAPAVRLWLRDNFSWDLPAVTARVVAPSDGTERWLLKLRDDCSVEMVVMPSDDRVTLCISTQVGCKMGCRFCATGGMGFRRNLSSGEILGQILLANASLQPRRVTNVVFMGMGEPLDNVDAVIPAGRALIGEMGLSKHRVTISTVGVVPGIRRLAEEYPMRLAVSLHAASDEKRDSLIPVNRSWPLADLKDALLAYPRGRHGLTFEYIMLKGINDSAEDVKLLVRFLHGLKAKVNLIPYNAQGADAPFQASTAASMRAFQEYLSARSIPAPIRYSRGSDIAGACGQLAAREASDL